MTVAAKITPTELGDQVRTRYIDNYFVVRLLNSNGLAYTPGLQDPLQYVIDYEIPQSDGYRPQIFGYVTGDVTDYADQGVGLRQKQAIFQHDGGTNGYTFDQLSVQWAGGVTTSVLVDSTRNPGPLNDGEYSNVPVFSNTGDGRGLSVNITVFNGAVVTCFINGRGFDYSELDVVEITAGTLASIGASDGTGSGQGLIIAGVYGSERSGSVVLIAPTSAPITLASGNESAVYFSYKNFGYYNTVE